MKNFKKNFLFFLILINYSVYTQSVNLEIPSINLTNDSIFLELKIKNTSEKAIVFYLPNEKSLCLNILNINFKKVKSKEEYDLITCDYVADVDAIHIDYDNSVIIREQNYYGFKLAFPKANLSSVLRKKEDFIISIFLDYRVMKPYKDFDSHLIFNKTSSTSRFL